MAKNSIVQQNTTTGKKVLQERVWVENEEGSFYTEKVGNNHVLSYGFKK